MSLSGAEYLGHILDEVDYLIDRTRGLGREAFLEDETLRRAFVRSLEVIGEAAKKVPPDYELVWDVVVSKVPVLGERIRELLEECE